MKRFFVREAVCAVLLILGFLVAAAQGWSNGSIYVQTNLVSDIPGVAQSTDPNLKNPWGVSFSATGPFWAANAGSNTSTVYSGTGSTVTSTVVTVPGGPTGTISNSTVDFLLSNGKKASFVFSTLDGSIYSWNGGAAAAQNAKVAGASFTGLALASNSSGNYLYAANILGGGSIEVFNATFQRVTANFSFKDPAFSGSPIFGSSGYVPYNIQAINGQLYVEYANFQLGKGAVSIFDTAGNFIKELIPPGGSQLNQPWGIVMAPAGFGTFAGDLLVGNLGDGKINAFDPATGAFFGTLQGFNGPLVNSGLWSLSVRTGGTYNQNAVYLMAGINGQADGLFGMITVVSPATVAITTPTQLPAAKIGTTYSQTLAVTGGTPGYSNWTLTAGSLPPGLNLDAKSGTISGTPLGIAGTFNFIVGVSDSTNSTGVASFQLTVQQPASSTGLSRIGSFAQLASGGGWKSTMTLVNVSSTTVNAQVNFYGDSGSALVLPLTFPQTGSGMVTSSLNVTLTPNDSIVIQSSARGSSVNTGWADVLATGALNGYVTWGVNGPGGPLAEATVPLDIRLSTSLVLPYDNTNNDQTALAIANQSAAPQTVAVTLFDQSGVQVASSQVNLPAFGHSAFFVPAQFAQAAGQLGIIQFQSAAGVTGIGLRFSPAGTFTSIPIIK